MLLRGHGRSSKASRTSGARHCNISLLLPRRPPHLLKVLALPQQVQPHDHRASQYWLVSYCFSAVHLPHTPINTGAAYVQSFYPSHLLLSFFLVVTLVQCIKLDHANRRERTMVLIEDKSPGPAQVPPIYRHSQYCCQLIKYCVVFHVILAESNLRRARCSV
ncbi:hypothetical protein EV702DRAFT_1114775 [Suillus placidus]|uniref:Uncharacterized protein n=1 Tax=Suillus placidus TaxID=48579 RepID=A0A9P6ZSN0_9AGAM|nr:hypothetical protein EV702DRAFT_1114775 [Suillus placidus]